MEKYRQRKGRENAGAEATYSFKQGSQGMCGEGGDALPRCHFRTENPISPTAEMAKAMATHSSTLAWKIPWMEEPGRLQVHGVVKSRTRLSGFTFTFHFHALEKEMATHSNVLAWRILGMGEPGGLPSMGSHRVRHNWSDSSSSSSNCWKEPPHPGSWLLPGKAYTQWLIYSGA